MVAFIRQSLTRTLPITGAVAAGVLLCLLVLVMPGAWLEALVSGSGVAALIPAAEPPLGGAARFAIAIGTGVFAGAIGWAALYLLFGPGGPFYATPKPRAADGVPTLRRADAHPDAPARRPLSAAQELAAPPPPASRLPKPARKVPADLDTPLSGFDPAAILPVPREPTRPVAPLTPPPAPPAPPPPPPAPPPPPSAPIPAPPRPAPKTAPSPTPPAPVLDPGERLDTFALSPASRAPAPPPAEELPSIDALLRRLEAGAQRRAAGGR